MKKLAIFLTIACLIAPAAFAQNWQPAGDQWIEKWWALDLVTNTGGSAASAARDYLDEGTSGDITNVSASTRYGAGLTGQRGVYLSPDNGGVLGWKVVTLDTTNNRNLSISHGFTDESNVTWHGIILILSPDDRTTTMYPAHDDHAEIWLNGAKVYDNPAWTTQAASQPTDIDLYAGENFLHFKCGEGSGGDNVNLRFDETDDDLLIAPTLEGQFLNVLTLVEPKGKVTTTWADIKRK